MMDKIGPYGNRLLIKDRSGKKRRAYNHVILVETK